MADKFCCLSPQVDYCEMQAFHVASPEMSCIKKKPVVFSREAVANSVIDYFMFAFLLFLPPLKNYGDR